jgi:lysophospholipase L1-like esterase
MIYIIGDSHVSVFSGTDTTYEGLRHIQPEFGTCYTLELGQLKEKINRFEQKIPFFFPIKIGSHTAYNSYNKINKIEQAIKEYKIDKKDIIFLCFGEIDIRNHIGFAAQKNNKFIYEEIKICVDRYLKTILYLKEKYNIAIYAPVASSDAYGYADTRARNKITILFNEYLEKKCHEHNIIFKDISKKMMLKNGLTDQQYIMDDIHLSQKTMPLILEEFDDIIKKYKDV